MQEQWQTQWNINKGNCALGTIKDQVKDWTWTHHTNRAMDTAMTRLRLDCANLKKNQYRINRADSPICLKCNSNMEENAQHYLMECQAYSDQRKNLIEALTRLGIHQPSMKTLMCGVEGQLQIKKEVTKLIAKFIWETNRIGEL